MKRALVSLALLLVAFAGMADDMEKYLPNTHDGWQNLTYGVADSTDWGSQGQKMEIVISGKYIHLAWMEEEKQNDGMYPVYYRRSSDYGKTWEKPKLIATNIDSWSDSQGYNSHWMWADSKNVRFAIPSFGGDNKKKLRYISSTDYGASFTTKEIAEGPISWARYSRPHIACDGQIIVIAANYNSYPVVFISTDGGANFSQKQIDEKYDIADLQLSGHRWTLFGSRSSGEAYDRWSRVFFSTSNDEGKTITTENLGHVTANGKTYADTYYLHGWNRATFDYHQQMVQHGDIIDLVYVGSLSDGNEGDPDPDYDYRHTIHRRSTDGGKTWNEAKYLPGSTGGENVIAANGDNIYIYSGWDGAKHVFYSHDGGKTWGVNEMATRTKDQWNPYNDYNLVIAPDDATGKHAYLTGERGYFVETRDGFQTINRLFALPSEQWYNYGDHNNWGMRVLLDDQGTEHWFMHFSPQYKGFEKYFWSIVHRRNDPVANTTAQNMALSIEDHPDEYGNNRPAHLVTVPMTSSLHEIKKATTVECWVRIDSIQSFQIAALPDKDYDAHGSIYMGGWYMNVDLSYSGADFFTLVTGMTTEQSIDGVGTQYWDRSRYQMKKDGLGLWHHFAFTYDASVEKDNFRTYADGMLLGTKTLKGDIVQGHSPIYIGKTQNYTGDFGQIDNFAVWDRALSEDELRAHLYNAPTGKENGCRLLLTFDGSLQDQSTYHNDAIALTQLSLKPHDGIRPPHPEFTLTKEMNGQKVYANDVTQNGEGCWWVLPYPGKPDDYKTSNKRHVEQDFSRNPGTYTYWLIAKGTGGCNAYAATSQSIMVGGLSKVIPAEAAPSDAVRLRVQGGYELTYSSQPKVVLKQDALEIEGKWLVDRDYNSCKVTSADELAEAQFDLREAKLGHYDVIVGNDTLRNGFELIKGDGYPDVCIEVSGRDRMLWGKYQKYSIDLSNRSNVAAYNIPFFLFVSDNEGMVDVSFDFPIECYGEDIPQKVKDLFRDGENGVVIDTPQYGPMRCFLLNIPYIGPSSEAHLTFRISMKNGGNATEAGIDMVYGHGLPMGAWEATSDRKEVAAASARASDEWDDMLNVHDRWDSGLAECFGQYFFGWFKDTAIGSVPVVGCVYNIDKVRLAWKETHSWAVSNLVTNIAGAAISCIGTVVDIGTLGGSWVLHVAVEAIWNGICNVVNTAGCLAASKKYRHLVGVRSYDPNEMIGPWGPNDERHYIQPIHQMPYMITFENKASASAPAHEVIITDTLDLSRFDAETFSFNNFGWADTTIVVGGSLTKEFTRDVNCKVNGQDIKVRVSGQFSPETGVARWAFVSLQKNGDEIDDPDLGFLLPNNADGRGDGFVSFSIEHKADPAGGSTVSNRATIVFDANAPITTNTYINTFDTDFPTSKVTNAEECNGQIQVTLQGKDNTSGIDHYTLYAFVGDSQEAVVVASGITGTQASFACEPGIKYGLFSIATDRVGHNELKDQKAELNVNAGGSSTATYELTVADAGYATFYDSQNNYQLPASLKASVVSGISGSRLTYQPLSGSTVPHGTAVLIEASTKKAATYTLTSTNDAATYTGENLLHGSDVATTTSADGSSLFYKLAYGPSGTSLATQFGWFWGAQLGAAFRIEGHRAWLAVPNGAAANCYLIDGEATDIGPILSTENEMDGHYHTLDGRKLQGKPTQPGIYFHNRRKIIVK